MTTTIYNLELENEKYYVGRSLIPKERILKHFQEKGSEWTKLHKPIKILYQVKGDEFDEEKHTLIAMEKYGIDNVRGGSYCKVKLTQNDKDKALQTIRSITDKCYKCGKKGHFAKDCIDNNCSNSVNNFNGPNLECMDRTSVDYDFRWSITNNVPPEHWWIDLMFKTKKDLLAFIIMGDYKDLASNFIAYDKYKDDKEFLKECMVDAIEYGAKTKSSPQYNSWKQGIHGLVNSMLTDSDENIRILHYVCKKLIYLIEHGEE
jgi:predicted GIY-YIG superfamily endonuclease